MELFRYTVNQDLTERYDAADVQIPKIEPWTLEDSQDLEEIFREKLLSYPLDISKSYYDDSLLSSSDSILLQRDETATRSGVFYGSSVPQSDDQHRHQLPSAKLKREQSVDLDRLLCDNSDERSPSVQKATAIAIKDSDEEGNIDLNHYFQKNTDYLTGATGNNPNIIDSKIISKNIKSSSDNSNKKSEYTKHIVNNIKLDSKLEGADPYSTSASQSPTSVLATMAEYSPSYTDSINNQDYYLLNSADLSADNTVDGGSFFSDVMYETMMIDNDKLFYTPDNSCGLPPVLEVAKPKKQLAPLTFLPKTGTLFNSEVLNTPNIINDIADILEASAQPMQFLPDQKEDFTEKPFFPVAPQELITLPSTTSSPAAVCDPIDDFLTTITPTAVQSIAIPVKKPGRPRKRRYTSDNEDFDDEDDDETYVPPSRRRTSTCSRSATARKKVKMEDVSEDSDDYDDDGYNVSPSTSRRTSNASDRLKPVIVYDEDLLKLGGSGKRGRPPKHSRSISSDDYNSITDPSEAKYREMRDRNNEASRKSRYKRKLKEMKISDELEALETENVKLKAEVDELQKTVDRYRDNLMKVMLSKK